MAAFEQERGAVAGGEFRAGAAHFVEGGDGAAEEGGGFIEVRGDEGGEGEKALAVEGDGVGLEERVAAAGDHDGIDDERRAGMGSAERRMENVGDGGDDGAGVEQAGFDGGDGEGTEEEADLLGDEGGFDGLDGAHFARDLGDDAGDGGDAVGAKGTHGFEIGLRAGPGAVVGTGDGENDGKGGHLGFRI